MASARTRPRAWTWRKRCRATASIPTTCICDGMLLRLSAVRSKYPRARVLAIHTEKAAALPGVVGVYTAADIPGKIKVGHLQQDWDAHDPRRQASPTTSATPSALWRRRRRRLLEQAKTLVEIDYEPLPAGAISPRPRPPTPCAPLVACVPATCCANKHVSPRQRRSGHPRRELCRCCITSKRRARSTPSSSRSARSPIPTRTG